MHMPAIAELAAAQQGPELAKALFHLLPAHMPQAELADARRVDQAAARGQMEQLGGGGGMGAFAGALRQGAHPQLRIGQQRIYQRGFADTRLPHKHTGALPQGRVQLLQPAALARGVENAVPQRRVDRQQLIELSAQAGVCCQQVGLVEQDHRLDVHGFGRHQVAVNQHRVRLGQGRDNHHNLVDIGCHGLELAVGVRPGEHTVALALRDDNPGGLALAPHHPVAGDQALEVGAQVAANALAGDGLDLHLGAEMSGDEAVPLRAERPAGQGLLDQGVALVGPPGSFPLDFFDAPGLLASEFAFGHFGIIGAVRSAVEAICYTADIMSSREPSLMQDPNNLIWVDMEMTGLDPDHNVVIEIATIVTDSELNTLAEGPVIAVHQADATLAAMDEWNTTHHTHSGLVDRVRTSVHGERAAQELTLAFLQQWVPAGASPMCGNSICQDRRFMARHLPELERYFHYRNLDVSTLKILVQRWRPELEAGVTKTSTHLALDDIRESIEEMRYYREHFLRLA